MANEEPIRALFDMTVYYLGPFRSEEVYSTTSAKSQDTESAFVFGLTL